jgi:hypothetical protein
VPIQDSAGSKRSSASATDPTATTATTATATPSPAKRLKLDLDVRAIGDLPGPVIMDVPLLSIKGKGVKLVLSIRPNDLVFVVNMGAGEAPRP